MKNKGVLLVYLLNQRLSRMQACMTGLANESKWHPHRTTTGTFTLPGPPIKETIDLKQKKNKGKIKENKARINWKKKKKNWKN